MDPGEGGGFLPEAAAVAVGIERGSPVFDLGFPLRSIRGQFPAAAALPLLGGRWVGWSPPAYGAFEIKQNYRILETQEEINIDYLKKIVAIYQERLKKLSEISELTDFFFRDKLEYDKDLLRWGEMSDKEITHSLDRLEKILSKIKAGDFNKDNLEKILMPEAEKMADRGYLLWPLRVALTGKEASAGPFEIAEILGREKTIKRIREAKKLIG